MLSRLSGLDNLIVHHRKRVSLMEPVKEVSEPAFGMPACPVHKVHLCSNL